MAKPTIAPDYAQMNRGIVGVSKVADLKSLNLPDSAPVLPSESKIVEKLPKLLNEKSLRTALNQSFIPDIKNRANLNPQTYQKKLKEAKKVLRKLKEEQGERDDRDEDFEEILEMSAVHLEDLEDLQNLLFLLRQVVHLA